MRPLSLARYIAASASRISSSALVGWPSASRATAIPIEALTKWSTPCIEKGWAKAGGDPLGDRDRLAVVGEPVDQDPELVAAEAGDDVAGAQVGAQPRRDGAQQGVAGVVAEAVVDQLEVVEVEEEDPDRRAGDRGAAERVVDRVDEAEPVGQAGEGVVEDAVAERLVGGVALEGVGEDVGRGFQEGDVLGTEAAALRRSGRRARRRAGPCRRSPPPASWRRRSARTAGGIVKRSSLVQSGTITGTPASSAAPACDSRPAETRRPEPSTASSRPARRLRRRPSRPTSQMQARSTPSSSPISVTASRISASGSPFFSARSPSRATTACWARERCRSISAVLRSVMS